MSALILVGNQRYTVDSAACLGSVRWVVFREAEVLVQRPSLRSQQNNAGPLQRGRLHSPCCTLSRPCCCTSPVPQVLLVTRLLFDDNLPSEPESSGRSCDDGVPGTECSLSIWLIRLVKIQCTVCSHCQALLTMGWELKFKSKRDVSTVHVHRHHPNARYAPCERPMCIYSGLHATKHCNKKNTRSSSVLSALQCGSVSWYSHEE